MRFTLSIGALLVLALPAASFAQMDHHKHGKHHPKPPETAVVGFGVLPLVPLGDAPCAQTGVGGPTDPCAYKIHVLTPNEATVRKGGEVTFNIHGGGHGLAIYKLSKRTSRDDIGQQLCPGLDPATIPVPGTLHACNNALGLGGNANVLREVFDARDDVVLVAQPNTGTFPNNRVWYEPGRLMSAIIANPAQFLNGGTTDTNGEILTYRFLKAGRYLVLCMNRSHFFNDWMFGFVDVED